jgi:hypothetical protein
MAPMHREQSGGVVKKQGVKMALNMGTLEESGLMKAHGRFIFDMRDAKTGEQLAYFEKDNVLTLDCGILAARLFRNSLDPVVGTSTNKGITHLDIGSGATGNILAPDAPQPEQRKLNTRLARKAVTTQFRSDAGAAVAYPTHIVDFTTTYSESEAVGPLNEMGLVSAYNNAGFNDINNGAGTVDPYDATISVSAKDLLANYLTFGVITKPATAILTITWRLTF